MSERDPERFDIDDEFLAEQEDGSDYDRMLDRVENRNTCVTRAALSRRHPGDHLRAVFLAGPGVKLPGGAGDSLRQNPRILVD